jgi:outer membrane murein-binding lipoprotein Lpp
MITRISKWTAWLVGVLALIAFGLSYNALQGVALQSGLPWLLSLFWPLLIDFALVVFSLSVVRANLLNERTGWPWFLVGVSTVATIVFNVIHVMPDFDLQWLKYGVAVMPPVALFLSFESLMGMVKSGVKRQEYAEKLEDLAAQQDKLITNVSRLTGQIEQLTTKRDGLRADIKAVKQTNVSEMNQARQDKIEDRRQTVGQMLQAGQTEQDIAEAVGVSLKTVQRDKATIQMSGNRQNGSH